MSCFKLITNPPKLFGWKLILRKNCCQARHANVGFRTQQNFVLAQDFIVRNSAFCKKRATRFFSHTIIYNGMQNMSNAPQLLRKFGTWWAYNWKLYLYYGTDDWKSVMYIKSFRIIVTKVEEQEILFVVLVMDIEGKYCLLYILLEDADWLQFSVWKEENPKCVQEERL